MAAIRPEPRVTLCSSYDGFIRQAAIGGALISHDERVEDAPQKLLGSRAWTTQQGDWLKRIAAQTKAKILVDREALDDPNLLIKAQGRATTRRTY